MRPLALLQQVNDHPRKIWLDPDCQHSLCLDSSGHLNESGGVEGAANLISFNDSLDLKSCPNDAYVTVGLETPIRVAVEVYYATGKPLPVVDISGKMIGVVCIREILRGVLQKIGPGFRHQGDGLPDK